MQLGHVCNKWAGKWMRRGAISSREGGPSGETTARRRSRPRPAPKPAASQRRRRAGPELEKRDSGLSRQGRWRVAHGRGQVPRQQGPEVPPGGRKGRAGGGSWGRQRRGEQTASRPGARTPHTPTLPPSLITHRHQGRIGRAMRWGSIGDTHHSGVESVGLRDSRSSCETPSSRPGPPPRSLSPPTLSFPSRHGEAQLPAHGQ